MPDKHSSRGDVLPARRLGNEPFQPNLYVVARFLDKLTQPGAAWTRSTLQAACGVNYDIFRRYLEFLEGRGFVSQTGDARSGHLTVTSAGRAAHERVLGLVREFLANPPGPRPAQASTSPAADTNNGAGRPG